MSEIVGFNDRCTLILLDKKSPLTLFEGKKLNKLKERDSNYNVHEDKILKHLMQEGFISANLQDSVYDEKTGSWINDPETEEKLRTGKYYFTNELGIKALNNGYFQSEFAKKFFETKLVRIGTLIGAVGGLISIIIQLWKFLFN
jgi:hypothetical protein